MKIAVAESLQKSHSYNKYRKILSGLHAEGKVSGDHQSEELLHYSMLNEVRMNRLDKTTIISETNIQQLLQLKKDYVWLVISEGWCGDAAHILPVLNKLSMISPRIELKIVFRDENESLMNLFLTNGNKSIPKLIILNKKTKNSCANWGPRPKGASDLITSYKRQYGKIDETAKTELQLWYNHDKGKSVQDEILALMATVEMKCE